MALEHATRKSPGALLQAKYQLVGSAFRHEAAYRRLETSCYNPRVCKSALTLLGKDLSSCLLAWYYIIWIAFA